MEEARSNENPSGRFWSPSIWGRFFPRTNCFLVYVNKISDSFIFVRPGEPDQQASDLREACPHQGTSLYAGKATGYAPPTAVGEYAWARGGTTLRCPWHGWEFEIATGESLFNPERLRVKPYPLSIERNESSGSVPAENPSIETFPVTVENRWIVLHL